MKTFKSIALFFLIGIIIALTCTCVHYASKCKALERPSNVKDNASVREFYKEYIDKIHKLQDSVNRLVVVLDESKRIVSLLEADKKRLKTQAKKILENYEKLDSMLLDFGIDDNIEFLSEYLSEEDDPEPDGHRSSDNSGAAGEDK